MSTQLKKRTFASDLARCLELEWRGEDVAISDIRPLAAATDACLCFSNLAVQRSLGFACAVIAPEGECGEGSCLLVSNSPRLDFARALNLLAAEPGFVGYFAEAQIAPSASIGRHVVFGNGVVVGANTVIHHHVVIGDGVKIGDRCVIKSGTVIGEDGFGFERDSEGRPIRLMHLGSVEIGDDVELGSLNTVCRGTLGNTIIQDDVKTDDHVHIAHNCIVRRGTLLTACVELSGGVDVGEFVWVGPNSSVINAAKIGEHAFVGIASNVTKSVERCTRVAGNPAKKIGST